MDISKSILSIMENYKELLTELYQEHAPEKIDQIDFYLQKYKGKEKQFYITQKAKYANKKSVTDSKKILEEAMARIKKKGQDNKIKSADDIEKKETPDETKKESTKKEEPKPISPPIVEDKKVKPKEPVISDAKPLEKSKTKKEEETDKKQKEVPKADINPPIKSSPVEKKAVEKKSEIQQTEVKKEAVKKENEQNKNIQLKEDTTNESIKTESPKTDTAKKESNSQKEDASKIKQENWQKEKEKLQQAKIKSEKKEKRKLSIFWYIGGAAVIILLVALSVWFLHFRTVEEQKEEPINVQKVKVEKTDVNTIQSDTKEEQEETKIKEKQEQQKTSTTSAEKQKATTKPETEKKQKPTKQTTQTRPTADRIYARDINKPAIFVGCFATKTESFAQKKIELLKQQNLDAHYYWIPDLDPNGNPYFKVVVGPFNSITEAYPSLTKAQERVNFDSYILIVD